MNIFVTCIKEGHPFGCPSFIYMLASRTLIADAPVFVNAAAHGFGSRTPNHAANLQLLQLSRLEFVKFQGFKLTYFYSFFNMVLQNIFRSLQNLFRGVVL